jgi:hypothetical protein
MRSRRDILARFGLGAAGCALASQPGSAQARRATLKAFASGQGHADAPWWLLEPLEQGDHLGARWTLEDLSPVEDGASVLKIRHPTRGTLAIHICSHAGRPRGYAHTELLDLIVMDGGRGMRVVNDGLADVFQHIADQLQSNELRDDPKARVEDLQRMMTHRERVQAFGPAQL